MVKSHLFYYSNWVSTVRFKNIRILWSYICIWNAPLTQLIVWHLGTRFLKRLSWRDDLLLEIKSIHSITKCNHVLSSIKSIVFQRNNSTMNDYGLWRYEQSQIFELIDIFYHYLKMSGLQFFKRVLRNVYFLLKYVYIILFLKHQK